MTYSLVMTGQKQQLGELSLTGGVVNAFNALLYVSKQQKNLRKL